MHFAGAGKRTHTHSLAAPQTANKYDCFMWDPSVGVDDWKKGFKPDSQLYSLRERGDGCKAFCNRQCCGR